MDRDPGGIGSRRFYGYFFLVLVLSFLFSGDIRSTNNKYPASSVSHVGNMFGVNSSDEDMSVNSECSGKHNVVVTSVILIVMLLFLSISGCVEPGMDEPDEVPDPTDVNVTPDEPMIMQGNSNGETMEQLTVTSPSFENGSMIPVMYTCDSENINPALQVSDVPADVASLLLIMDDPDAPSGTFTHWVVWNIHPVEMIEEDSIPGVEGVNGVGKASYTGPCPPSGTHRYFFKFYALDTELDLADGSERDKVEDAMDGHVMAYGELIGLYSRS